jgi:hypothetical protein
MSTAVKDDVLKLQKAYDFFVTKQRRAIPGQRKAADDDKTIYDTDKAGQGALTELEQTLPPNLLDIAQEQRKNMLDLMGVGSAWLRGEAAEKKNPGIVFDPKYLMEMYSSLPLLAYTGAKTVKYSEKIRSVEIAGAFLGQLIGFAVSAGTGLADFRSFLTALQEGIKAGVKVTERAYSTFTTAMVYVQDQATKDLEIRLDGYMIAFSAKSSIIDIKCASIQQVDIEFEYQYVRAPFRYHRLADPVVKKWWDDFINDADKDDLERAKNKFKKKSIDPQP